MFFDPFQDFPFDANLVEFKDKMLMREIVEHFGKIKINGIVRSILTKGMSPVV